MSYLQCITKSKHNVGVVSITPRGSSANLLNNLQWKFELAEGCLIEKCLDEFHSAPRWFNTTYPLTVYEKRPDKGARLWMTSRSTPPPFKWKGSVTSIRQALPLLKRRSRCKTREVWQRKTWPLVPTGLETEIHCAGEGQKQFNPPKTQTRPSLPFPIRALHLTKCSWKNKGSVPVTMYTLYQKPLPWQQIYRIFRLLSKRFLPHPFQFIIYEYFHTGFFLFSPYIVWRRAREPILPVSGYSYSAFYF
jgi:hypothetical protein